MVTARLETLGADSVGADLRPGARLGDRIRRTHHKGSRAVQGLDLGAGQDRKAEGRHGRGGLSQGLQLRLEIL